MLRRVFSCVAETFTLFFDTVFLCSTHSFRKVRTILLPLVVFFAELWQDLAAVEPAVPSS